MLTFDSLELCQRVRQDATWGDLLILAITTHTDAKSVQKVFAAGVDDFVSKPIVGPELVTRVVIRLERLRYQNQSNAFEQFTIGISFVGLDDRWLKVNPTLCQLLGYSESELLTTLTTALIYTADVAQWQQSLQKLLEHKTSHCQFELRYCGKGDRIIPVSINTSLVCDNATQPLYVLAQMQAIATDNHLDSW